MKTSLSKSVKKGAVILGGSILSVYSMWTMFSNTPNANAAGPCLVTIFGKQYDVAPLQTGHSGGNVFTCGTDMSSVYQGMHGTNVSQIAALLVATPTPTPTPTPVVTPTPIVTPTPGVTPTPTPAPVVTPTPTGTVVTHNDDSDEDENEDHRDSGDDDDDKDEHKNRTRNGHGSDSDENEDHRDSGDDDDDKEDHRESRNED